MSGSVAHRERGGRTVFVNSFWENDSAQYTYLILSRKIRHIYLAEPFSAEKMSLRKILPLRTPLGAAQVPIFHPKRPFVNGPPSKFLAAAASDWLYWKFVASRIGVTSNSCSYEFPTESSTGLIKWWPKRSRFQYFIMKLNSDFPLNIIRFIKYLLFKPVIWRTKLRWLRQKRARELSKRKESQHMIILLTRTIFVWNHSFLESFEIIRR